MTWWLVTLAAAVGCWLAAWAAQRAARGSERASRPRELAGAQLAYMEKVFRIEHPLRLVATVDRVYQLPDGMLVLVELKTRWDQRARPTDIIQLSAQKLALEVSTGLPVARFGYVSTKRPNGKAALTHHRVGLLDAEGVLALATRRHAVLKGAVQPDASHSKRACDGCAFRARCDRRLS